LIAACLREGDDLIQPVKSRFEFSRHAGGFLCVLALRWI
jgi:hypothetical protein